jgi:general secretion pathway protein D
MTVLKLHRANADDVKTLYDSLNPTTPAPPPGQFPNQRKPSNSSYFPEDLKMFVEPRTNSLILLGAQDAIRRVEDFVIKYVDTELDQPYSPLYPYHLKFADAATVAKIMTEVTPFGKTTEAGKAGGVRGNDKFLKPMSFIAEKSTNTLIIRGDYRDYLVARSIIAELDEEQPQVALEFLIISLSATEVRELGSVLRTKNPGTEIFGNNVKWQTSGLRAGVPLGRGIQTNTNPAATGVDRLLGNLLQLIVNPLAGPGNTIVTLGQDLVAGMRSVWGIFQALQTVTNAQIVASPFLTVTNNTKATTSVGETRRVESSIVFNTSTTPGTSFRDDPANLSVTALPRINSDGYVIMDIDITFDQFTNALDLTSGTKLTRSFKTQVSVANEEILAIGGFIRNRAEENLSKVPFLADIPILGWLAKNKRKATNDEHLLILISTKILDPEQPEDNAQITRDHVNEYQTSLDRFQDIHVRRDPVDQAMFNAAQSTGHTVDQLIFTRQRQTRKMIEEEKAIADSYKTAQELQAEADKLSQTESESRLSRRLRTQKPYSPFANSRTSKIPSITTGENR